MRQMLLAAGLVMALGSAAYAQSVGGTYKVDGTSPDGGRYTGTAEITPTSDTTCNIVWRTGSANEESSGICMRYENAFSAGYVLGDAVGLVIYEIKSDGTLDGIWTVAGQKGSGTEVLTPQ